METRLHSRTFTLHERRFLFEEAKEAPTPAAGAESVEPVDPRGGFESRTGSADEQIAQLQNELAQIDSLSAVGGPEPQAANRASIVNQINKLQNPGRDRESTPKPGPAEGAAPVLSKAATKARIAQLDKELRFVDLQIKNGKDLPDEEMAALEERQAALEAELKEITPEPVTNYDRLMVDMNEAFRALRNAKDGMELLGAIFQLMAVLGEFLDHIGKGTLKKKIQKPEEPSSPGAKEEPVPPVLARVDEKVRKADVGADGSVEKPIAAADMPKRIEKVREMNGVERKKNEAGMTDLNGQIAEKEKDNLDLNAKRGELETELAKLKREKASPEDISQAQAQVTAMTDAIAANRKLIDSYAVGRTALEQKNKQLDEEEVQLATMETEYKEFLTLFKEATDEITTILKGKAEELPTIAFSIGKNGFNAVLKGITGTFKRMLPTDIKMDTDDSIALNNKELKQTIENIKKETEKPAA